MGLLFSSPPLPPHSLNSPLSPLFSENRRVEDRRWLIGRGLFSFSSFLPFSSSPFSPFFPSLPFFFLLIEEDLDQFVIAKQPHGRSPPRFSALPFFFLFFSSPPLFLPPSLFSLTLRGAHAVLTPALRVAGGVTSPSPSFLLSSPSFPLPSSLLLSFSFLLGRASSRAQTLALCCPFLSFSSQRGSITSAACFFPPFFPSCFLHLSFIKKRR